MAHVKKFAQESAFCKGHIVKKYILRYKKDILIIGLILVFALLSFVVLKATRERGAFAEVSIDGKTVASYSLSEDREETFQTSDGSYNIVCIENGKVFVKEADCRDGLCMQQGKKSDIGETIVCLPHKLVVTVTGGQK